MIQALLDKIQSTAVVAWDCWLWPGTSSRNYGAINFMGKRIAGAHRASWIAHNGPIPDGLWVLHRCNTRYCVNPSHLYLGTRKDNTRDAIIAGHHTKKLKFSRRGQEYTPENTFIQWNGKGKGCKTCKSMYKKKKRMEPK